MGLDDKNARWSVRTFYPTFVEALGKLGQKSPMRTVIVVCFALMVMRSVNAAETPDLPAATKTTDEITGAAEKIKGFGIVQSAEFNRVGRRIFAVWYCPFSGRAACYLRVYYFDLETSEWRRFVDRLIEGTHDLSGEMPSPDRREEVIVFKNVKGEVVLKESVADLPRSPRPKT